MATRDDRAAFAGLARASAAARSGPWDGLSRLLDRHAPAVFIMPAVLVVLAMSIFPLLVSLYLSLSRFQFVKGGFELKFIGLLNYKKLLLGASSSISSGPSASCRRRLGGPRDSRARADRAAGPLCPRRGPV